MLASSARRRLFKAGYDPGSEITMHLAANVQFERAVDEFVRWRAVPEHERSAAPAWWWGPAFEVIGMQQPMPAGCRASQNTQVPRSGVLRAAGQSATISASCHLLSCRRFETMPGTISKTRLPARALSRGTPMPIVQADRLTRIGAALLKAAGASDEEANAVAVGCVNANLAGHDSHGIIAVPTYIDRIKAGHIVPGAKWTIVQETPTTTVIDGHWGFGFHVNAKAMALTIEKAKTANVAACTVFRQSHVGRLAAYPMMAMREGMIGLATADSGRSPKHVAPFGGREARLGTNPISIAVPSDLEAPFYLDMATSAVAAGKIQLAAARGEEIPTGWIVDSEGRQTTDPKAFRKGGALLPLGGSEGYKGSGLAAMVEVLCGLLTGLGFGVEPTGRHNDGCFMAVFNVAAFRPLQDFKKEVAEFARYLKSTPPSEGSTGVLYPGEVEYLRELERRKNGIEVEDATWDKLRALAAEYKIADELGLA